MLAAGIVIGLVAGILLGIRGSRYMADDKGNNNETPRESPKRDVILKGGAWTRRTVKPAPDAPRPRPSPSNFEGVPIREANGTLKGSGIWHNDLPADLSTLDQEGPIPPSDDEFLEPEQKHQ